VTAGLLDAGPGTPGWATKMSGSASLSEDAARLQAVSAALAAAPNAGPCGDDCGCTTALAAAGTRYHFPHDPPAADQAAVGYCDVRVYVGGKTDWTAAGLPFDGSRATPQAAR
jgi:hypothetical protein